MPGTRDTHVTSFEPLVPPCELDERLPITPAIEAQVTLARETITRILAGDDPRLLVIAGPCSIHDEDAALEYATRLRAVANDVVDRVFIAMRVYFEKPRTTVGWKGLINDPHLDGTQDLASGLFLARQVLLRVNELGLPAATEFLDPFVPQYIAGLVSWAAIGARTTESQTHRQMASGLSMPVGFKNSTAGNTQVAVDAVVAARSSHGFLGITYDGRAAVVQTTGNDAGHVVLRGGSDGPNFDEATIDRVAAELGSAGLPGTMIVDCSHANSGKNHERQAIAFRDVIARRAGGDTRLAGLMLESHLHPGNQKLGPDPSQLAYGVSITDACVGWDETETLIREAHAALAGTPALA